MNVSQGDLVELFSFFSRMKGEIYEHKNDHTVRDKMALETF